MDVTLIFAEILTVGLSVAMIYAMIDIHTTMPKAED